MATQYWAIYPAGDTTPTAAEIIAQATSGHVYGTDTAPDVTTTPFTGTAITGLSAGGRYRMATVWDDGAGAQSNVAESADFLTPGTRTVYVRQTPVDLTDDYGSLTAAETGEQADFVAAEVNLVIKVEAGLYEEAEININGSTTSGSYKITIQPLEGHEHNGIAGQGPIFRRTGANNTNDGYFNIQQDRTLVEGITIQKNSSDYELIVRCGNNGSSSRAFIHNCFINRNGTSSKGVGIQLSNNSRAVGNIVTEVDEGIVAEANGNTIDVYNNMVDADEIGIGANVGEGSFNANSEFKNNIVTSATIPYASSNGTYGAESGTWENNACETANNYGTGQINNIVVANDFIDHANGNYRPAEGGLLDSAGVDVSTVFTTDVAGRHRRFWSVGPFDWHSIYARVLASPTLPDEYSTLKTAESGEQGVMSATLSPFIIECEAITETTRVTIDGYATSTTRRLTVRAASGHEHNGVRGTGYILTDGSWGNDTLNTSYEAVTIENIEVRYTGGAANTIWGPACIAKGVLAEGAVGTVKGCFLLLEAYNCVARDGENGFHGAYQKDHILQNCVAINCSVDGFTKYNADSMVATNCVGYGCGQAFDSVDVVTGDYNASDDTTAPGTTVVHNITSAAFVDYAGGNFRPAKGGVLDGVGSDLSGNFTTDIAGRHRRFWSIGAFDYFARYARVMSSPANDDEYSTFASAEAANQANLGTLSVAQIIEVEAGTYAENWTINGYTPTSAYRLTVRPVAGAEHNGKWSGGVFVDYNGSDGITVSDPYVIIDGLRVQVSSSSTTRECIGCSQDNLTIRNCFLDRGNYNVQHI